VLLSAWHLTIVIIMSLSVSVICSLWRHDYNEFALKMLNRSVSLMSNGGALIPSFEWILRLVVTCSRQTLSCQELYFLFSRTDRFRHSAELYAIRPINLIATALHHWGKRSDHRCTIAYKKTLRRYADGKGLFTFGLLNFFFAFPWNITRVSY